MILRSIVSRSASWRARTRVSKYSSGRGLWTRYVRNVGVPFTLDICGAGEIEPQLKRELQRQQLSDCVRMRGVLNFATELLPMIAQSVDLFVCCHRQGDPSCTYLETLACGTPIVSYDNEAFQGIATMASIGWMARMNEPALLARRIGWLHQHRQALARSARNALRFASEHTLESTMQARIDHLLACADDPQQTLKGAAA